jgi:hypothetical protein
MVLTTHPLLVLRTRKCTETTTPPPLSGPSGLLRGTFSFFTYRVCNINAVPASMAVIDSKYNEILSYEDLGYVEMRVG